MPTSYLMFHKITPTLSFNANMPNKLYIDKIHIMELCTEVQTRL